MTKPDKNGWLPIETAPRDGTSVDLWLPIDGRVTAIYYQQEQGVWAKWVPMPPCGSPELVQIVSRPTHWRPVPEPPEDTLLGIDLSDWSLETAERNSADLGRMIAGTKELEE